MVCLQTLLSLVKDTRSDSPVVVTSLARRVALGPPSSLGRLTERKMDLDRGPQHMPLLITRLAGTVSAGVVGRVVCGVAVGSWMPGD